MSPSVCGRRTHFLFANRSPKDTIATISLAAFKMMLIHWKVVICITSVGVFPAEAHTSPPFRLCGMITRQPSFYRFRLDKKSNRWFPQRLLYKFFTAVSRKESLSALFFYPFPPALTLIQSCASCFLRNSLLWNSSSLS